MPKEPNPTRTLPYRTSAHTHAPRGRSRTSSPARGAASLLLCSSRFGSPQWRRTPYTKIKIQTYKRTGNKTNKHAHHAPGILIHVTKDCGLHTLGTHKRTQRPEKDIQSGALSRVVVVFALFSVGVPTVNTFHTNDIQADRKRLQYTRTTRTRITHTHKRDKGMRHIYARLNASKAVKRTKKPHVPRGLRRTSSPAREAALLLFLRSSRSGSPQCGDDSDP